MQRTDGWMYVRNFFHTGPQVAISRGNSVEFQLDFLRAEQPAYLMTLPDTLEIGAQGVLSGDGGIVNVANDVILGGTIDPGNSPGRIRINCNLISLAGSRLIIEIAFNGEFYEYDRLIIDAESTYDLTQLNVVLSFVGEADPNAFAASGGLDLDNFILAGVGDNTSLNETLGLSTRFAAGQTWDDVIDPSLVTAVSSRFDIRQLVLQEGGGFALVAVANAVPEPPTWALLLAALFAAGAIAHARRRAAGLRAASFGACRS